MNADFEIYSVNICMLLANNNSEIGFSSSWFCFQFGKTNKIKRPDFPFKVDDIIVRHEMSLIDCGERWVDIARNSAL